MDADVRVINILQEDLHRTQRKIAALADAGAVLRERAEYLEKRDRTARK